MLFKEFMAAIFALSTLAGQAQEKQFSIIPEPVEIFVVGNATYQIGRNTQIRVSEADLLFSANYLADYMNRYLGIPLRVEKAKSSKRKGTPAVVPAEFSGIVLADSKNGEVSGGYQLTRTADKGILVKGNDVAGVFYVNCLCVSIT